jgi:hypothetical protein
LKCFKATLEFLEGIQPLAGAKLKPCQFMGGLGDGILPTVFVTSQNLKIFI